MGDGTRYPDCKGTGVIDDWGEEGCCHCDEGEKALRRMAADFEKDEKGRSCG